MHIRITVKLNNNVTTNFFNIYERKKVQGWLITNQFYMTFWFLPICFNDLVFLYFKTIPNCVLKQLKIIFITNNVIDFCNTLNLKAGLVISEDIEIKRKYEYNDDLFWTIPIEQKTEVQEFKLGSILRVQPFQKSAISSVTVVGIYVACASKCIFYVHL